MPDRSGGDEREIEAVAVAIYESRIHSAIINGWTSEPEALRERFRKAARAALARVRGVRDDNEGCPVCGGTGGGSAGMCPACGGTGRSPQGEGLADFQENLTRALNEHGVPAMPSWQAAIDWLAEHGGRSPQDKYERWSTDHGWARGDDRAGQPSPQGESDRQRELRTGVANTTVENYRRALEDVHEMVFAHCRRLGIPLMSPPRVAEALDALAERAGSPQGEDHEAGNYGYGDLPSLSRLDPEWGRYIDHLEALLSRCPSPERLMCTEHEDRSAIAYTARCRECAREFMAPSPERDTEKLVEALRRLVELKDHPDHDNIDPIVKGEAWRAAREALAEFTASKAGETPEEKR